LAPKEDIVELLNAEIDRLTRARDLLMSGGRSATRSTVSYRGGIRRRRLMIPETKRKISGLIRKRWEQRRKGK